MRLKPATPTTPVEKDDPMRVFPRAAEAAVRALKMICEDTKNPVSMRARSAELILSAYNLANLPPDRVSKHNGLRQIQRALELSATDRKIAGKVRAERREQITKVKQELETL
jgi:hypothetical protein